MEDIKRLLNYFTRQEIFLWGGSVFLIVVSFCLFDKTNYITFIASLIGVTSLIFNAKGNPFGQLLMIIFSLLYGIISFSFAYYGEMITYLGMTMPMAVISFISWLRNPYNGKRSEVKVNITSKNEQVIMWIMSVWVTCIFYFVLKYFNTANLIISTLSVTTSFIAVYLTFMRSPYYAIGYAANDIVLIALWILASVHNRMYISVVICFFVFLVNDIYGFINWQRMKEKQSQNIKELPR